MEMLRARVETLKMDGGSAWMDVVNAERTQGKTHQDKGWRSVIAQRPDAHVLQAYAHKYKDTKS